MKLSIGIVGLPNVGKSTLFNALTNQSVNAENYPFATIDPNVGVVAAPDDRTEKVSRVVGSKQVLPAVLEFVDIAGLVAGAHEGKGMGNQFLAHIREVDAIIHIVRVFGGTDVVHFEGDVNPLRDFETLLNELRSKDEESKEKENLLSAKPQLVLLNGTDEDVKNELTDKIKSAGYPYVVLDLQSGLDENILTHIFELLSGLLNLITFFTANENEARSWFVEKGTKAPAAAEIVHTDFKDKFIKAEVIDWEKLMEADGWQRARQKGWLRIEGKDYVVRDGDVMLVKI